jgi:hypothetical protein
MQPVLEPIPVVEAAVVLVPVVLVAVVPVTALPLVAGAVVEEPVVGPADVAVVFVTEGVPIAPLVKVPDVAPPAEVLLPPESPGPFFDVSPDVAVAHAHKPPPKIAVVSRARFS